MIEAGYKVLSKETEMLKQIELLRSQRVSLEKIAENLHIKKYDIELAIKNGFIKKEKNHTNFRLYQDLTDIEKVEIKKLYKEGYFVRQISEKFNISSATVRMVRAEDNIKSNFLVEFNPEQQEKILELYEDGIGIRGIADRLCLKQPDPIKRFLKSKNIKLRTKKEQNIFIGERGRVPLDCKDYVKTIRELTEIVKKLFPFQIENHQKLKFNGKITDRKKKYAVDHIYSVFDASALYKKYGRFEILWCVCHPANLRVITASENSSKSKKSLISYKQLKQKIYAFDEDFNTKNNFVDGFWQTILATNPLQRGSKYFQDYERLLQIKRTWGYTERENIKWV